jgi:hypothetical protein
MISNVKVGEPPFEGRKKDFRKDFRRKDFRDVVKLITFSQPTPFQR